MNRILNVRSALLTILIVGTLVGCAALADIALEQVTGQKGGINTELVLGDKKVTLGNETDVTAGNVGKVIGTNDNSVLAENALTVKVTNNTVPKYMVLVVLVLAGMVGWLSPRPKGWKRLIKRNNNEHT
jgi:hypothetical protein